MKAGKVPPTSSPPTSDMAEENFVLTSALGGMLQLMDDCAKEAKSIDDLARWTAGHITAGSRLFVCGNGGSAAESQHFAGELVGRYHAARRPLPAVALCADGALLTCLINDFPTEMLFARQVAGLGCPGDLLVVLSTSGQSPNVKAALNAARAKRLHTLALLGKGGGSMAGLAEREWIVPSQSTARIQEAHLFFIHIVCDYVDLTLNDSQMTKD